MTCPVCGESTEHRYRPFCSRRCADVDLGRWIRGDYAIPGRDGEVEVPEPEAPPPRAH